MAQEMAENSPPWTATLLRVPSQPCMSRAWQNQIAPNPF